jgi:ribosomal protein S18 acetylase RimI-like enzyme
VIAELEERAFSAWPAAEVVPLGGWQLRATSGVTRRANSAWTAAEVPDLERAIARVEAFYAERALPAIFQLCPLSPAGLDEALAARGYAVDAPVAILSAELAELHSRAPRDVEARVDGSISADWFELAARRTRFAAVSEVFRGIVERIGARAGFALATVGGAPAAAALGVCDRGWLGVFAVATLPEHRRRGAATALLDALRRFGESRGATRAYLQVERDNEVALSLYRRDGFREVYGYYYRAASPASASTRSA